jgi:DNA repair/transcription protein MET18/MMS19
MRCYDQLCAIPRWNRRVSVSFPITSLGTILTSAQVVRTSALRCLGVIPDAIRFEALQSEKSRVVRDLGRVLDDPLRSVRKEAVECRAKWSVLHFVSSALELWPTD